MDTSLLLDMAANITISQFCRQRKVLSHMIDAHGEPEHGKRMSSRWLVAFE